ncbi:DUF1521 domain-containing protein [Paraburkholderia sp.]|uniref:DUF1521 domain-containing protein n=1 Tax=Paraburkholderia sp. TaxID=1926495 RepID=UPI002AFE5E6D|nr:DUF1521 domain-containing protein [Paraburkholderia sp.]
MQLNTPLLSLQGNLNTFFGGAQPQRSPAAGFNGGSTGGFNSGFNQSSQMSNMLSGFSKTSFSVFSQTSGNGQSSTYFAQGSTSNRGQAANPQPIDWRGNGNGNRGNYPAAPLPNRNDYRCDNRTSNYTQTNINVSSRNNCCCNDSGKTNETQWSNTAVSNNKASIDLGDYKLDFNKSDSSMTMTNAKTGDKTKVWGDPHLTQHENGANKSTAMFNGPMTFMLPDNTKVTVGTQPGANNKSVSYADQVTITRGNQAYQVTGLSQEDKAGLSVQKSRDGRALDAAAPDGYTVLANRNGSGWIDPATGKEPTAADITKANK